MGLTMSKYFDSIMVFGEVLFDVFPDESRVIGGAPFNVACHLKGLGFDPLFISRIGLDEPGREVISVMESMSLSLAGLQKDRQKMTGVVHVQIDNDEPSYSIAQEVAYDYIRQPDPEQTKQGKTRMLYHGTLAARNSVSASTLYELAEDNNTSVFCDINLRDPWWTRELVRDILRWCDYLKVNEDELREVCAMEGITQSGGIKEMACSLRNKRGFKCLVVTLGARGAMLFPRDDGYYFAPSPDVRRFQDSVGAGDAFSSVVLTGIVSGWSWELILKRAVSFAALICENRGAIPDDSGFYQKITQSWE